MFAKIVWLSRAGARRKPYLSIPSLIASRSVSVQADHVRRIAADLPTVLAADDAARVLGRFAGKTGAARVENVQILNQAQGLAVDKGEASLEA